MLTTLLLSLGATIIMAGFSFSQIGAWKQRGFDAREIKWEVLIAISAIFGLGVGVFSYLGSENPYSSATIAIAGYLLVFASTTDILLLKIPSEPTKLAALLGTFLFLFSIPTLIEENYLSLIFWGILLLVFGICSMLGYLGDADMRLFITFFFLFAWWVPPTELTVALLLMAVLGLVTRGLAAIFDIGVDKAVGDRAKWDPSTGKMEAQSSVNIDGMKSRKERRVAKGKKRKFFPLGPAILMAFVGVAIFASFNSIIIPTIAL